MNSSLFMVTLSPNHSMFVNPDHVVTIATNRSIGSKYITSIELSTTDSFLMVMEQLEEVVNRYQAAVGSCKSFKSLQPKA